MVGLSKTRSFGLSVVCFLFAWIFGALNASACVAIFVVAGALLLAVWGFKIKRDFDLAQRSLDTEAILLEREPTSDVSQKASKDSVRLFVPASLDDDR